MRKKILALTIICIAGMVCGSCGDSFLEVKNPAAINARDFYKDSLNLMGGLTGMYRAMQNVYGYNNATGLYLKGDVATDNSSSINTSTLNWEPLSIDPTDLPIKSLWQNFYLCISRANAIIANGPEVPMGATKNVVIAEAKLVRAWAYFEMAKMWGGVPVVTQPFAEPREAYNVGRSSVGEVYAQALKDVSEAYAVLPDFYGQSNANAGRLTKAAAIAMWGEMLLTQKKYPEAKEKLAELVGSANEAKYNVTLLSNYADVFSTTNEMNKEIIFAVRYITGNNPILGSPFTNQFLPIGLGSSFVGGTTYSSNLVTADLRDAFEPGDLRKAGSIDSTASRVFYAKKFLNPGNTVVNDANNDWIVYRFADILLLYAEALNESGQTKDAVEVVNRVRKRAGLAEITSSSMEDLRKKVLAERRVELNMEGKRWDDLARNGVLIETLTAHFKKYKVRQDGSGPEAHRKLFPIPFTEILFKPDVMTQNEGY